MSIWSWLTGFSSLLVIYLMGKKWKWSPVLGLVFQSFWFLYVFIDKQYGILPGVIGYTFVHGLNSYKWLKKEK